MSTTATTPTPASSSSPATSTTSSNEGSPQLTTSASLYLYTFLATLVLLLSVSAAIVVRSYLLRRRQRMLIEEAIRNGTYIPPMRTPKVLGAKPVLHDAYLSFETVDDVYAGTSKLWWSWTRIMPVAVSLIRPAAPTQPTHPASTSTPAAPQRNHALTALRNWYRPPPQPSPSAQPAAPQTERMPPLAELKGDEEMRVAVLIAMPGARHERKRTDEEGPPYVEFGIATVGVAQDALHGHGHGHGHRAA